jgi:proteasome lid subunit RPN8/RPN11
MVHCFKRVSQPNTLRGIEMLGFILGRYSQQFQAVVATVLLIPRQTGTPNSCQEISIDPAEGDEPWVLRLAELQAAGELSIGWIHTHPTFTCFFSNVDSHTNALY